MKKIKIIYITLVVLLLVLGSMAIINKKRKELVNAHDIETDSELVNVTYNNVEDIWDESVLGILTIEKIGLNATVKEGSNNKVLKQYIGHIEETAIYDGNIGLART